MRILTYIESLGGVSVSHCCLTNSRENPGRLPMITNNYPMSAGHLGLLHYSQLGSLTHLQVGWGVC